MPEVDPLDRLAASVDEDPVAAASYADATRRRAVRDRMVKERERAGLRQKDVAELLGTRQPTISQLERESTDHRLATLQRYARAVGRRLDFAVVDPDLPVLTEELAGLVWKTVRQHAAGPLLRALRDTTEQSKRTSAALAAELQLPEPAIAAVLRSLTAEGITGQRGDDVYDLNMTQWRVVGLRIARDTVSGVLTEVGAQKAIGDPIVAPITDPSLRAVADVAARVVARLGEFDPRKKVIGIGVAMSGWIDRDTHRVAEAPDLRHRSWLGADLRAELTRRLGDVHIVVENDANALALSEYANERSESIIAVLMSERGEGIGSGVAVRGHLIHGVGWRAGEIGHVWVADNGLHCRYGTHKGCLETVASPLALLRDAGFATSDLAAGLRAAIDAKDEDHRRVHDVFYAGGTAIGDVLRPVVASVDAGRVVIYAPERLHVRWGAPATALHDGLTTALRAGGDPFLSTRLEWHGLEDHTLPVAAAIVATEDYFRHPSSPFEDLGAVTEKVKTVVQ